MKISQLKDGQLFRLTPKGVIYELQTIGKKHAVFTSKNSGRTYTRGLKTEVCAVEGGKYKKL